ncbi:MAG TPA: hypothetical protein VL049_20235, partial [Candidatus Dormibacteraeota bacterium]|nr:hypothetical protein [Candidatus Dormibacteraeota bacterium]
QVAGGELGVLLIVAACATAARATPITYQFSGTGSGTVAGSPFTDAAYVISAAGDTAAVEIFSGFPFPGTVASAAVTVTMEIAGIGTAALAGGGVITVESPTANITLQVASLSALLRAADLALLGYDLRSPFGPLVLAGPPILSHVGQPSDLGVITLDSSSAVTFEAVTTCGNGILDPGEECDDGNASGAGCCAPGCLFASAGTTCRFAAAPCDAAEVCSGTSATCPPDGTQSDGSFCFSTDICSAGGGTCQAGTCVVGPRDCDDHVPCTQDSCDPSLGCVHVDGLASDCLAAEKSTITLAPGAVSGEGKLSWRWAKGAALALADLSDPTVDASYELCVYSGSPGTLTADAVFAAGSQWSRVGTSGYRFKERVPSTVLRLRGGAAGKSMAVMKGRGVDLAQPFPFAAPVIVQLRKQGSPLCLESRFDALRRSDATKLKAQTP